ncbi:MFS transporter [Streptomyces sp. H27-H1]|uniref:MFS transporter n=1 Tax=Streptomyces sp. H27-H1 TaxID=2996461 RepID=UPI00227037D8|nr:MFS transporter [Streptomyces sp. H27-H1]MCY0931525.1 MFS transporter [Streptomyces sp. H27-H1]
MTRHRAAGGRHARLPDHGIFRRIYLPRTMDAAAFNLGTYGIPLLVLATTSSAMLTGLAFVLEWIPRLGAFVGAGAAVDRHGAARVFRTATTIRTLVVTAAVLALTFIDDRLVTTISVMALAAVIGVLTEYSYVAAETAGGAASRESGRVEHRVQSVLLSIDQSATLAGPAAGAFLLQYAGQQTLLTTIGVLSLLAAITSPRDRRTQPKAESATVRQGLRMGWSTLRALPALGWLIAGLTVSNFATGLLQAAAPVIIVQNFGLTTGSVGLIWSAAATAALLATSLSRFAIDRFGLWPIGTAGALIASLGGLAVSQAGSYTPFLILVAVLMAGEGAMTVVLRTLRSRLIPRDVFGATLSITILIMLLPFPIAGLLVAVTPPESLGHVMTACAALQALGLATAFWRLRSDPALRESNRLALEPTAA